MAPDTIALNDWLVWHTAYDVPGSPLAGRLAVVQQHLQLELSDRPAGPIRLLSINAGPAHDVIGVLADHPRAADVHAQLLEPDPRNCDQAVAALQGEGLDNVTVTRSEVGAPATYARFGPVDIVLAGGLFGTVAAHHLPLIIAQLPDVCDPGAGVIWTRHRRTPDAGQRIRRCFAANGFAELAFETTELFSIGTHRLGAAPPAAEQAPPRLEQELTAYQHALRACALRAA